MYRKDLCALCTLFDLKCCNKRMLSYCDETLKKNRCHNQSYKLWGILCVHRVSHASDILRCLHLQISNKVLETVSQGTDRKSCNVD